MSALMPDTVLLIMSCNVLTPNNLLLRVRSEEQRAGFW